ncbi:organic cation transporter protein-like [Cephus cinctus]|uniref:Organic cation transporter protein-like n=1 Tax=Cephus cinctus TaxID=211228 RepID=A0AAJ7BSX7_CEPCN|nr:organic cation transporter protein-like [Cephus cinctus]
MNPSSDKVDVDKMKIGCYQISVFLLIGFSYMTVSSNHILPAFHNFTPKYFCEIPNENKTYGCTSELFPIRNQTKNLIGRLESCPTGYHFETVGYESTVVTEWELICERRFLASLGTTFYVIGILIGAWLSGFIIDRIGRLPVLAMSLYTQGALGASLYIVQDYSTFLIIRGLQGVFIQGLQNASCMLIFELFPTRARTIVGMGMQLFFSFGIIMIAGLSFIIPDWRILQLGMAVPTAVTVLYIWIIPESPRWLIAKGKFTEADIVIEKFDKYNACCSRTSQAEEGNDTTVVQNSNGTNVVSEPKRRSRILNIDIKKNNEEIVEESTNLLHNGDVIEQKVQKVSLRASPNNLEKRLSNFQTSHGYTKEKSDAVELKPDLPSNNSNSNRNSKNAETAKNANNTIRNDAIAELEQNSEKDVETESDSKELETENDISLVEDSKKKNTQNIIDLLKHKALRRYLFVTLLLWFSCSVCYYTVTFLLPSSDGNKHISFATGGALDICGYTIGYFILNKFGRRIPICIGQCFSGSVCLTVIILTLLPNQSLVWIGPMKTILLVPCKSILLVLFTSLFIYTMELFPTVVRGASLGLCGTVARIGTLITPQVLLLGDYVSTLFPIGIAGILSIISGLTILLLPETLHESLPDTIEDCERLFRKRKQNKNEINNKGSGGEEETRERNALREKLFSEEWVDAGNGIIVNFSENKNAN